MSVNSSAVNTFVTESRQGSDVVVINAKKVGQPSDEILPETRCRPGPTKSTRRV